MDASPAWNGRSRMSRSTHAKVGSAVCVRLHAQNHHKLALSLLQPLSPVGEEGLRQLLSTGSKDARRLDWSVLDL